MLTRDELAARWDGRGPCPAMPLYGCHGCAHWKDSVCHRAAVREAAAAVAAPAVDAPDASDPSVGIQTRGGGAEHDAIPSTGHGGLRAGAGRPRTPHPARATLRWRAFRARRQPSPRTLDP